VQVFPMTGLGLVPISRKRIGVSLAEALRAMPMHAALALNADRIEEDTP
jgi:hypothetical protein